MDNIENFSTKQLVKFKCKIKYELLKRFVDEELEPKTKSVYSDDNDKLICKYCSSTNTIKAGKTKQCKQRYKCKDCNKNMITVRNTLLFSSKKKVPSWLVLLSHYLMASLLVLARRKQKFL